MFSDSGKRRAKQRHTNDTECATKDMGRDIKVIGGYETGRNTTDMDEKEHETKVMHRKMKNTPPKSAFTKDGHEFGIYTSIFPLLHY